MKKIITLLIIAIFLSGCSKNNQRSMTGPDDTDSAKFLSDNNINKASSLDNQNIKSDGEMVISNNNKFGAFLTDGTVLTEDFTENVLHYNQIWLYNFYSQEKEVLVKSEKTANLNIINKDKFPFDEIYNLQIGDFSNDNKYLYFFSRAWTTSAAIFSVNLETKEIKFISNSNYLEVIEEGEYKDYLILSQHRYYPSGGSYDNYYIVDPSNGKEIKDLGDNLNN